jgi:hypothetical protein
MSDPNSKSPPKVYRSRLGVIPEDAFVGDPDFIEEPKVSKDMADWLTDRTVIRQQLWRAEN